MANTLNTSIKRERDIHYYRQRFKNRVYEKLVSFFAKEAERTGVTKKDIASRLKKDPAQVTRWLASPGNLTLDTISDLLLALDAEVEPITIVRFADRRPANYAHPLVSRIVQAGALNVVPRTEAAPVPLPAPQAARDPNDMMRIQEKFWARAS